MNKFEIIRQAVPLRDAAMRYGLRVSHNSMACCPFHRDRHPSLKLNETYFYCFGCGANGDVIDLTAKLLGVSNSEAARTLETDFGLHSEWVPAFLPARTSKVPDNVQRCISALQKRRRLLQHWQQEYCPQEVTGPIHPRFEEALKAIPEINYFLDCLLHSDRQTARVTADMLCSTKYLSAKSAENGRDIP